MQGGIQQRGVDAVAGDIGVGGQLHLGIHHIGIGRGRADTTQRPKRAAIAVTLLGQPLIETVVVDGLDTRGAAAGRPAAAGCSALNTPLACNIQAAAACSSPVRACTLNARRPLSSSGCTMICTSVGACSTNTNGVCKTNSSITGQPASSPARNTTSMNPVAGNTTLSDTACPPSQPCVAVDNRPLNTTWS